MKIIQIISVILTNLIPIAYFYLFNQTFGIILFWYWVEVGVIGVFALFKIRNAKKITEKIPEGMEIAYRQHMDAHPESSVDYPSASVFHAKLTAQGLPLLFVFTFGIFYSFYGILIVHYHSPLNVSLITFTLAVLITGFNYWKDYRMKVIEKLEFNNTSPEEQFKAPFLHIFTIIVATFVLGILLDTSGSTLLFLCIFVVLKIVVDIIFLTKSTTEIASYMRF